MKKEEIKKYYLHKDDSQKLHFEIKDIHEHLSKYPDKVYKAHRHSFFQFIWFKKTGKHYIDYKLIEHSNNCIVLLNKNQVHHFDKSSINDGLLFHFDEVFINRGNPKYRKIIEFKLFDERQNPVIKLTSPAIKELGTITSKLQDEISLAQQDHKEMIFALMQQFVVTIGRIKNIQLSNSYLNDDQLEIAIEFKRLIDDKIDSFLGINSYASEIGINATKLAKISNKYFGTSPAKFITERKILEAKRQLSNNKLSIKEIAFKLGFDQPTYFTKYFKKNTGMTPKEFSENI